MTKILALGDSITNGYDGYQDLKVHNYPRYLSQILNVPVTNYGVNNAMITRNIPGDLPQRVRETDFTPYDLTIIFYGTNDYGHRQESLNEVLNLLQSNLSQIQKHHPHMKLMGIVPMNRYDYGNNAQFIKGIGGYDMQSLQDGIKSVYQRLNIPVLDWRTVTPNLITDQNYQMSLNDSHLHPTQSTYQTMAKTIATFIRKYHLI